MIVIYDVSHKNIVTKGYGVPQNKKKKAKKRTFSSKVVIIYLKGFEDKRLTTDNCLKSTFL